MITLIRKLANQPSIFTRLFSLGSAYGRVRPIKQEIAKYNDNGENGRSYNNDTCYRCLQNKRPLRNHTPRLSNPFPPKFNVDEMQNVSGSACKINTRFRKIGSVLSFQL